MFIKDYNVYIDSRLTNGFWNETFHGWTMFAICGWVCYSQTWYIIVHELYLKSASIKHYASIKTSNSNESHGLGIKWHPTIKIKNVNPKDLSTIENVFYDFRICNNQVLGSKDDPNWISRF